MNTNGNSSGKFSGLGAVFHAVALASVHKSLRIRYLWKELGFTRASRHTVWSSRFWQAKADAGLVLLCPLASPPNCEQFCCEQETVASW